jgi:hypothetical protein
MALTFQAAAPQLVEAFAGQEMTCAYHDPVKKVLVLVVSGTSAEGFKKVVDAVQEVANAEGQRMAQSIADALKKEKLGS